jgi:DNA-binding SARP family transcriptional activator
MTAYPRAAASYGQLEDAFWPGRECETLRHRLHMAAAGARAALRKTLPTIDAICMVRGGYAWNPGLRIESDYQQLLSCYEQGTIDAMKRGIALYAGEFCSGESAEWMYALRARASAAYADMLERLAVGSFSRGDSHAALRYALQLIEADRGHEEATRLAMQSFAAMGRRRAALEKYQDLRRWLRLYLGVEPSVASILLRDEIACQR